MTQRCALVMAGGTGGHIFPGLAVADALRERGWRVHWLGAPGSMEQQLVPPRGYPFEAVAFGGVRGKGALTLALLPLRLLRAFARSIGVIRRVKPDVLVGLGGYITFPGGRMGRRRKGSRWWRRVGHCAGRCTGRCTVCRKGRSIGRRNGICTGKRIQACLLLGEP